MRRRGFAMVAAGFMHVLHLHLLFHRATARQHASRIGDCRYRLRGQDDEQCAGQNTTQHEI